jgi:ABC-type polysaccharide/polyol phosphate transport system ATPase subunit
MDPVIRFEHVNKKYHLGVGRISLREAVSSNANKMLSRDESPAREDKILWALKDVTFDLPREHALGLIGPNGAGKTTILKILAKITRPSSGLVEVKGRTSALIELGAGFHPDLTGRDNVYLNGAILGLSRKEITRLFDRIVDFSGLERFIDTPVKRYSSGMYVRLGFSVAAHIEPDVLLVDEVLAVGDAQFRTKCAVRIAELKRVGTTIVFVAHNLYLVKSVCDTAIFMNHGQIQEYGDSVDAISAYESWLHQSRMMEPPPTEETVDPSKLSYAEITHIEVNSLNSSTEGYLNYSDSAEIRVHYDLKQPIDRPNLVLRIMRADGTTCAMIRTEDFGYDLGSLNGKGVISIGVDPIQLSGGAYVVDAKLMMGSIDGIPIALGHSSWFQVAGLSLGHVEASGVFVPKVAWARLEEDDALLTNSQ